ncbi:MAG: InlB B-repeat-containing protein [Clostridia bacterium]|nr:InlB B-repeat-containing protein [Clostridia bacterium]
MKRLISVLIIAVMIVGIIPLSLLNASAVNGRDTFSAPYSGSKYYTQLMNARNNLGADKAINIAKIAESQAGYLEGTTYQDLDGYQSGGKMNLSYKSGSVYKNYTGVLDVCEYNFWYYSCNNNDDISKYRSSISNVSGATYPVSNYNKAWCAAFVSWCAYQAGVTDLIPINAGCGGMYKTLINSRGGKVVNEADRKPGDIVFYACDTCNQKSHVGIISTDTTYSIEGNAGDKVKTVKVATNNINCMYGHATRRIYVRPAYCTHSATYSKQSVAATCTANGKADRHCSLCDAYIETITLPKTGHSYDKFNHCSHCGEAPYSRKGTCRTGVYNTKRITEIHSTPYSVGKNGESNTLTTIGAGKAVAVNSAVRNRTGELWYSVYYMDVFGKSTMGYIEANHLKFFQDEFVFKLSKSEDFTVKYGEKIKIPEIKREGYTLIGYKIFKATQGTSAKYFTAQNNGWKAFAEITKSGLEYRMFYPTSDLSMGSNWITEDNCKETYYKLIPVWKQTEYYTISYDANGGLYTPQSHTKEIGKAVTLSPSDPVRAGYVFMGWSTSATGGVEYHAGTSYDKDASIHLYAVWVKNPISFDEMYIKNLTSTSALLGCNVTADCSKLTEIGLMIRPEGGQMEKVAGWKTGSILTFCTVQCGGANAEAPALTPNTTYYYRFYVYTTNVGPQYSEVYTFTTP